LARQGSTLGAKESKMIHTGFNMYSDANGRDPDVSSPTLRYYHKLLWSKPLPNGSNFALTINKPGHYLYHKSPMGEFSLGSDAITHSYKNQRKKKWLTTQIPAEVQALFDLGSTIGGYLIFPNKQIERNYTVNQARGTSRQIDDRFDLTLECIRRFYISAQSPLEGVLNRYSPFFQLFGTFKGYVEFFLLQDLVDDHGTVKFYLPFDRFQSAPGFRDVDDYRAYKSRVESFIVSRNRRIADYAHQMNL
jgi:hypothetical protein